MQTNALRYLYTARYLKLIQVYGRIWFRIYRPKPDLSPPPPLRTLTGAWVQGVEKLQSLIGPAGFIFLNQEQELRNPSDWNNLRWDKLWLYNLHYFDDLNARGAVHRTTWHKALLDRWIAENPPAKGNGWDSYPLSLRVVNWIKWSLAGNSLSGAQQESLGVQLRWLHSRVEWHLLGNHLLANAKALVFGGLCFSGAEAKTWLGKGMRILEQQMCEQILADGGHFERSPMYHALVLEDMLDIINLSRTFGEALPNRWRRVVGSLAEIAERMVIWLQAMCHPDGEICFFNDSAQGIAGSPSSLGEYASRLGVPVSYGAKQGMTNLHASGYVRVDQGPLAAILDVAPIGPGYLPGHAHADTLSFEASLYGQRLFVNSGTSCYGEGPERNRQRGTSAHNTVEIDRSDSSEVWGGFRVARRAYPGEVKIKEGSEGEVVVSCSHNGYRHLSGKPVHRREWHMPQSTLLVTDTIDGEFSEAVARFHFHPQVTPQALNEKEGKVSLPHGKCGRWEISGGEGRLATSTYHPMFGFSIQNQCLEVFFRSNTIQTKFTW